MWFVLMPQQFAGKSKHTSSSVSQMCACTGGIEGVRGRVSLAKPNQLSVLVRKGDYSNVKNGQIKFAGVLLLLAVGKGKIGISR